MENETLNNSFHLSVKKIDLMELLPEVLNVDKENFKMTPSSFAREMSLTSDERHKKSVLMSHNTKTFKKIIASFLPHFKVIPQCIIFQKFEARSSNSLILQVINMGTNLLPIKMHCPESMYFSAKFAANPKYKLAPGLAVEYEIIFTPKEAKDYSHHLLFKSNELTFNVPVLAIGPRPLLDIPDHIYLNPAPVKIAFSKSIVIRNIGIIPATFNLITYSPFQVYPSKGYLKAQESMVLEIIFKASIIGEFSEKLYLTYETGEKLTITLQGASENVSVRLDKNSIIHEDTYVGLKRWKTVHLCNNSLSPVNFIWKKNKSLENDINIIESMRDKYKDLTELTILKDATVKHFGLSNSEVHKLSCERLLKDELQMLEKEEFFFTHEAFTITPEKGSVWPKSSTEIKVVFEPKYCGTICTEAYLEVSGRDNRLPLQLKGTGVGPKIILNTSNLDIDYVYLCSLHRYEIVALNKGDIPGKIEYIPEHFIFGGKLVVEPSSRFLSPEECGVFVLSFTSNRSGEFTEEIKFKIVESNEILKIVMKGKIVTPTLHFDINQIDFGVIPFGFPKVREVALNNLSVVPVSFSLKILSDGETPSLSFENFAAQKIKQPLPNFPKEFEINPKESVVEPFSSKKVTLTLTSNKTGKFVTYLIVDMWDVESVSVSCPIVFETEVPILSANPKEIIIPFCFINFPYVRSIVLNNSSDVIGYFYIVPFLDVKNSTISFVPNIQQGTIEPQGSIRIDLTIVSRGLGRQILPINLLTFGKEKYEEVSIISCVGQGPLITASPNSLQWGELNLLQKSHLPLILANECPIPASLTINVEKTNSRWSASPSNFTLEPFKTITVIVSIYLNDVGRQKDTLKVNINNGKELYVPLSATGVGSCLQMTPKIYPKHDLGLLFSNRDYRFEVDVENRGTKAYGLVWSPFQEYKEFANVKFKNPSNLVFKIEPSKMDLVPEEKKVMILEVRSDSIGCFSQMFYCFARIGVPSKQLHLTCLITAEFVEPLITFDKTILHYWCNVGCDGTEEKLEDEVTLTNESDPQIQINCSVAPPFYLQNKSGENISSLYLNLDGKESQKLKIKLMAEIKKDKVSQYFNRNLIVTFKEHAKQTLLPIKGEINYPNVIILPKKIDFEYVPLSTNVYREINLINTSPLTVYYEIFWNTSASKVMIIEKNTTLPSLENYNETEEFFGEYNAESIKVSVSEPNNLHTETLPRQQSEINKEPEKPIAKMPHITVTKTEVKSTLFQWARECEEFEDVEHEGYKTTRSSDSESSGSLIDFAKVCDITPFYGQLEKFSSQILSVRFCSNVPIQFHAEAVLRVKSGTVETITINASTGDVDFELSSSELNFGKQLFCDKAKQILRIRNTGCLPFPFEIDAQNFRKCELDDFPSRERILTVSPLKGSINAKSEVEIVVQYIPGVPGKFEDSFHLQIACLKPIPITIKGFGVFPQVHISLPRPDMLTISPPEIGYEAIANLCPDWFTGDIPVFHKYVHNENTNSENFLEEMSNNENWSFINEGWEIIDISENMPSDVDIQLSIERILASNLLEKHLKRNISFSAYARTIPQFIVPFYEIDFGVVIIGRTSSYNVTVTNYGPLHVIMYGISNASLKEDGVQVRLKNRSELAIKHSFTFTVSFLPRKNRYKQPIETIKNYFYFEVYHGPKIPIKITALVTYPAVIPSMYAIKFGEVICGCCKVINLKLKNSGLVPAFWKMVFTDNVNYKNQLTDVESTDGRNMFYLNNKSGVLCSKAYCTIQVSFKPEQGGSFSAVMWIQVKESLKELKVVLTGTGIEPILKLSHDILTFGPTLPHCNVKEKIFTIENPCSFPIEIYFPFYDEQIFEEDKILRAICFYYQSKEILLPVRKPGEGLPDELISFYQMLLDGLNTKYNREKEKYEIEKQEKERERMQKKIIESSADISNTIPSDTNIFNFSVSNLEKKQRSQKFVPLSRTSVETTKTSLSESRKFNKSFASLSQKSPLEIEKMLQEYITELLITNDKLDPIQTALRNTLSTPRTEEYTKGLLIIFHGAPLTKSVQMANRTSNFTNLKILGIDKIVLEEAALARFEHGSTVKELIEQAYEDYVKPTVEESFSAFDHMSYEMSEENYTFKEYEPSFETDFEEIKRKWDALVSLREKQIATKNKVPLSARSEDSKKEKNNSPKLKTMNLNLPIANITEQLIFEILKFRLAMEINEGIIIEGLNSNFIDSATKALIILLKAAGNVSEIIAILLLNSMSKYNEWVMKNQLEKEKNIKRFKKKTLKIFEEQPTEVLDSLSINEEELNKLKSQFIEKRHKAFEMYKKKCEAFKKAATLSLKEKLENAKKIKNVKKKISEKGKNSKAPSATEKKLVTSDKAALLKEKKNSLEEDFDFFEMEFLEIKLILEKWDQRIGSLINGSTSKIGKNISSSLETKILQLIKHLDFDNIEIFHETNKFKKGQTPRKYSEATNKSSKKSLTPSRGVYMWLVDVSNPDGNVLASVTHYLKTVIEALNKSEESDKWPLTDTESKMFSVVVSPEMRNKPLVDDTFQILPQEKITSQNIEENLFEDSTSFSSSIQAKLNRSNSQVSVKSKKKVSTTSTRRRKTDSRLFSDVKDINLKKISSSKTEGVNVKSRWILNPGEIISCVVKYCPKYVGEKQQTFYINIVNWENKNFIHCVGKCDIPAIDINPDNIFSWTQPNVPLTCPISPAYYYSLRAFHFGSVLTFQQNDGRKGVKKTTEFNLTNNSTLPVDLSIIINQDAASDDGGPTCLKIEPTTLFLQPDETAVVVLTVTVSRVGFISEDLLLIIKDNPAVNIITIQIEGEKPKLTFDPKLINFDRLLLYRKNVRQVIFTNNNSSPVYFTLIGIDNLPRQFEFSSTAGKIMPSEIFPIKIRYEATEIQKIVEQPIQVQVYDEVESEEPVLEFQIPISVEAYDVALDISFTEKDLDHIDFGDILVENEANFVFNLKNSGKYLLEFRIDFDYSVLGNVKTALFYTTPPEGRLLPDKMFPVKVVLNVWDEIKWNRMPLVKITLAEPYLGGELIAQIPIEVSARSHFSRYEISPLPQLNFGPIKVDSVASESVKIKNVGIFPINYYVKKNPLLSISEINEDIHKKSVKATSSSKEKSDKRKKSSLLYTIGPFEISSTQGTIEVGETVYIKVTCTPNEEKNYEETILIIVNESLPQFRNGNALTILAQGCVPKLNLENFKILFREHYFQESNEKIIAPPAKSKSYTVFNEKNRLFSFCNVCLNKTAEARIHLQNIGLIDCHVTCKISSYQNKRSRDETVSNFSVFPNDFIIEPYNSMILLLTFTPDALQEYRGRLIIEHEMPKTYEDDILNIELYGYGVVPQIEIIEPFVQLPEGEKFLSLPSTIPGLLSTSIFSFLNIGPIHCKVIIELFNNEEECFFLVPKKINENLPTTWEPDKPVYHTVVVSLFPDERAEFNLTFAPKEIKTYSAQIKLYVVDNPFENLSVQLIGEAIFEEIMIEKIKRTPPFSDKSENSLELIRGPLSGQYILDFGECEINKKSRALLRLVNKTQSDYFRFEWENFPNLIISPSIGHLNPNCYKEILITFQPDEPVELDEVALLCKLNKIVVLNSTQLSWDTRLTQPEKLIHEFMNLEMNESLLNADNGPHKIYGEEPDFEIIPDSYRTLTVTISAIADYTRFKYDTSNIIFKNTYMFQSCIHPLVLENTGNITAVYNIQLKSVTAKLFKKNNWAQNRRKSTLKAIFEERPHSSSSLSNTAPKALLKCNKSRPLSSAFGMDWKKIPSLNTQTRIEFIETQKRDFHNPFVVKNSCGEIPPGQTNTCNIVFSPLDVDEFTATLNIHVENLPPEVKLPEIKLIASSKMPYCHFNIPESDYLQSGRRDCSRLGPIGWVPGLPLNSDTKTVEVKVLGTGQSHTLKFYVINPTEDDYTFSWINNTQIQPNTIQSFSCTTTDGRIQAGRQQQMVFQFVSEKVGIVESFWKFCIPKYEVNTQFLFVGDVKEPSASFLSYYITFRPTFIGTSSTELLTLVNHENIPLEFTFVSDSLYSDDRTKAVTVKPNSGKVLANSDFHIRVTYTGTMEGKAVFNLKCNIQYVKEPLIVTLKAITYLVQPLVVFEDLKTVKHQCDSNQEILIDFGEELIPNIPENINFFFTSASKTSFYYEWIFDVEFLESRFCKIEIFEKNGYVPSLSRKQCKFTVAFFKKSSLKNFPIQLKIKKGPTFNFIINASASTPLYEFSFLTYDFGPCFVQETNLCFNEVSLIIRNKDIIDLTIEAFLDNSDVFSFSEVQNTIESGKKNVVNINFCPKESKLYLGELKFIINGLYEKIITLKGQGTELKVMLENSEDTRIHLGAIRAGKSSTRKFSLVNKSLASVNLIVGFADQFPVEGRFLAKPEQNAIDLSNDHRLSKIITIIPSNVFKIKPQDVYTLKILYTPKSKSSTFSETVCFQVLEKVEPLLVVTGCCLGPEILLDRNSLNFGSVVNGCSKMLKLKIVNSGNIGAKFKWDVEELNNCTISPVSGYCSPESCTLVEVTFYPTLPKENFTKKVLCKIEISQNETYPPLILNLTGNCISVPEPQETVFFKCKVRETVSETVEIKNDSGNEWLLFPIIKGEYFKGNDAVITPPMSSVKFEIHYFPLVMTSYNDTDEAHEGSLMFRLPNGKCLLFQLQGAALPPAPEDVITREIPCKTKYTELLKIKNWLKYPQRLQVIIKNLENDNQENSDWSCTGFKNLDLLSSLEKEYSLNFFAYNTGKLRFHVTFINEESKEYMWYDITFNVVMCGPLEVITLKCGVRQTCEYQLKLENPLKKIIRYKLETTSPWVTFDKPYYDLQPESNGFANILFTPIHAQESTEQLNAICQELGVFPREIRLISLPPQPNPPITFETPLGSFVTKIVTIKNLSSLPAVLNCKADNADFIVKEEENVAAGETAEVKITYEPSDINSTTATIFIDSEQAGNFIFSVYGISLKPPAKGPFSIKPGSGIYIPFKNVFAEAKDFFMYVDNVAFILKTTQENIEAKEEKNIYVGLHKIKNLEKIPEFKDKKINPRFPIMGQLIVESLKPQVKWRFYLKGILEKNSLE